MTHHEQTALRSSHPPLTAARCYISSGWAWLTCSLQRGKPTGLYKDNHSDKQKKISSRQVAGRVLRWRTTDERLARWRSELQTRLIFISPQRKRTMPTRVWSMDRGRLSTGRQQTVVGPLGGGPGTKCCFQRCECLITLAKCVIRWPVRHQSRGGTEFCCVGDAEGPSRATHCDNRTDVWNEKCIPLIQ